MARVLFLKAELAAAAAPSSAQARLPGLLCGPARLPNYAKMTRLVGEIIGEWRQRHATTCYYSSKRLKVSAGAQFQRRAGSAPAATAPAAAGAAARALKWPRTSPTSAAQTRPRPKLRAQRRPARPNRPRTSQPYVDGPSQAQAPARTPTPTSEVACALPRTGWPSGVFAP